MSGSVEGYDFSSLSDEQIAERLLQAHARLAWALSYGSGEMVSAMTRLVEHLEGAQIQKLARHVGEEIVKAAPGVVESDPVLAAQGVESVESAPQARPDPLPTVRIQRTTAPVIPTETPDDETK